MKNNLLRIIGIFMVLIAIIAAGYYGVLFFMTSVVPSFSSYGLILVAIIAGIAMFFNPCSFTLLPTFLTFFASKSELKGENKLGKFLLYGLFASLGIITFSVILGVLIGLLGAGFGKSLGLVGNDPSSSVRIFRGAVGGLIATFGIMHCKGISFKTWAINKWSQKIRSPTDKSQLTVIYL